MGIQLSNARYVALMAAARVVKPAEAVDYAAWAPANIVFSKRESAFPGPYNPDLFPFFTEILKAFGPDDPCRVITLHKSAQLGGTVLANVFTLGTQAMDPCDFLYVHPTDDNAVRWSKLKLKPMLRSTPSVARLFPERSRDGGDSILFKERADGQGSILISGANSPASLSQVSMPRQVQDDLAKWTTNEAGDPEQQADSRSRAYDFAKIFKNSTPLVQPGCRITRSFEAGSQEYYQVPCPHCGHMHALEWGNMLQNLDEAQPERACFACPSCGGIIEEHHRRDMVLKGTWVAQNPTAARHHRSFHLWSAYGPLTTWEAIAREWLKAKGDPAAEQTFLNDTVGQAYEAKGEAPPWEELRDRAAKSEIERRIVPVWCVVLTLGIDVQKDRVEWQLIGWGRDFRRHVVEKDIITGHISEEPTMTGLTNLLATEWRHQAGTKLKIDMAAIDGNAWTEDVWGWARRHPASRLIMVRGVGSESAPLLVRVKKERNRAGKLIKWAGRFYNFGTSVLKMALYRNVAKLDPMERGYVGFPKGLEDEYFRQLTAEHRQPVKRRDGFLEYKWVKDPNQANEMLDTMLQAEAAAIRLGLRDWPDKVWDRLESERATPPKDAQLDLEDLPLAPKPAVEQQKPATSLARPKPTPRPKRGGFVQNW
ncbi:phage terminase large subunit family protein [Aestuariivirga litoralis]|uniref:phage terminase large subunit family protein n=1 Tax=Aestuariivirga litoralis TaxID=2650924 RepID=UPI0018C6DC30|nr:terminase gpA endonuclease subunit [Aestuariivirga litoralis]MBG1232982.1 terminase [Aestuariivirga litoralis]